MGDSEALSPSRVEITPSELGPTTRIPDFRACAARSRSTARSSGFGDDDQPAGLPGPALRDHLVQGGDRRDDHREVDIVGDVEHRGRTSTYSPRRSVAGAALSIPTPSASDSAAMEAMGITATGSCDIGDSTVDIITASSSDKMDAVVKIATSDPSQSDRYYTRGSTWVVSSSDRAAIAPAAQKLGTQPQALPSATPSESNSAPCPTSAPTVTVTATPTQTQSPVYDYRNQPPSYRAYMSCLADPATTLESCQRYNPDATPLP